MSSGDGHADFIAVTIEGAIDYYQFNLGLRGEEYTKKTGVANPFHGIYVEENSTLEFSDVDGDGEFKLVITNEKGTTNYRRTGHGVYSRESYFTLSEKLDTTNPDWKKNVSICINGEPPLPDRVLGI